MQSIRLFFNGRWIAFEFSGLFSGFSFFVFPLALFAIVFAVACGPKTSSTKEFEDAGLIDAAIVDGGFEDGGEISDGGNEWDGGNVDGGAVWTGPEVEVVFQDGFPRLSIDGRIEWPYFFAANTQVGLQDDWEAFDRQLELAKQFSVPIVSMCMGAWEFSDSNQLSPEMRDVFDRVVTHHPDAFFLPRVYVHSMDSEGVVLQDFSGDETEHVFNTLSDDWIEERRASLGELLLHLDSEYPGRMMGVHLSYLETGEWFFPGAPDGLFADYSEGMKTAFCDWMGLADDDPGCRIPDALVRDTPNVGNVFLDKTDDGTKRAIRFNRFISEQVVKAISGLARTSKEVSGGKAMVMTFYGYLYALADRRLTSSGHLAFSLLLEDPNIDAIVAPYQYGQESRRLGGAMLPHGPVDSPALHGKLWIHEDDTRTHLCSPWGAFACNQAETLTQTVYYLRRNAFTAALHQNGIYLFDLLLGGWFGQPGEPTSTDIWLNVALMRERFERLQNTSGPRMTPEIAVFVDDRSSAYLPVGGVGGQGGDFNRRIQKDVTSVLSRLGTPVRHYLLSDLAHPQFPHDEIKMAVFLNAFRVDETKRQHIRNKLEQGGKTLVYFYAPGVMDENEEVSAALASDLLSISLHMNSDPASLTTEIQAGGPIPEITALAGAHYGPGYGVAPWFHTEDPDVEIMGRYFGRGDASFVFRDMGTHKVVFSGAPSLPVEAFIGLAREAGVHIYSSTPGDNVEAHGNALMLHNDTDYPGVRTIELPFAAGRVIEDTLGSEVEVCTNCSTFETFSMDPGAVVVYWIE